MSTAIDVSVIIPVHNAEQWLEDCLHAISQQDHHLAVEISIFFDSCDDASEKIVQRWISRLEQIGYSVTLGKESHGPRGVGYAKNRAISQSQGQFLCFQDADDVMLPKRIQAQYDLASRNKNAIVGCMFRRTPPDSTSRYTRWANNLTHVQLNTQIYTSNGPTVIMPTWFCHREVISRAGSFDEGGRGTPEDLMLFFRHLRLGADVMRVDQELLVYRYHREAATFSIHEDTIWHLRVRELEERVLSHLSHFTIWNAGKQGRKLFRSIREDFRARVSGFCDVDRKKIGSVYTFEQSDRVPKPTVPIMHFREAEAPFIICVKMDLTGGVFEQNLESLNLSEGKDYFHFN